MANHAPKNSVWSAMEYKPPRGRCNFKSSLLSSSCSCLRFMLHPVKAATSFDCDGCGHHASFHSLENTAEDAVLKKWSEQEASEAASAPTGASKKRRRIAAKPSEDIEVLELDDEDEALTALEQLNSRRNTKTKQPRPA